MATTRLRPRPQTNNISYNEESDGPGNTAYEDSPKRKRPRPSLANRMVQPLDPSEIVPNPIFDRLSDPDEAPSAVALWWMRTYKQERDANTNSRAPSHMALLVNLVIRSSGCEYVIPEHHFHEPVEAAPASLSDHQDTARRYVPAVCPFLNNKDKRQRQFREAVQKFVGELIRKGQDLMYDDAHFLTDLMAWVVPLTSSALRSFRYTATVILAVVVVEMCREHADKADSVRKIKEDLQAPRKRISAAQKKRLTDQLSTEEAKVARLKDEIAATYAAVLFNRSKDVDARIRAECVKYAGAVALLFPEEYLDPTRALLADALTDSDKTVRHNALRALADIWQRTELHESMRLFVMRSAKLVVRLAGLDPDLVVRHSAAKLLCSFHEAGFLQDSEILKTMELVFDSDPVIRDHAASMLHKYARVQTTDLLEGFGDNLSAVQSTFPALTAEWLDHCVVAKLVSDMARGSNSDRRQHYVAQALWSVRVRTNEVALDGLGSVIKSVVDQLLFDYSSLVPVSQEQTEYAELFSLTPDMQLILLEFIRGIYDLQLELAAPGTKHRSADAIIPPTMTEVNQILLGLLPGMFAGLRHAPSAMARVLNLLAQVDLDSFRHLKLKTELETYLDIGVSEFVACTDLQTLDVYNRLFVVALKPQWLAPFTRQLLDTAMESISSSVSSVLDNDSELDLLLIPLTKLERLCRLVSCQSVIDSGLGAKLIEARQELLMHVDELEVAKNDTDARLLAQKISINILLAAVLRSYVMWKVGVRLSSLSSSSSQQSLELLVQSLDFLRELSSFINPSRASLLESPCWTAQLEPYYTELKLLELDALIALRVAKRDPQLHTPSLDRIPTTVDDRAELLTLFSLKRRRYCVQHGRQPPIDDESVSLPDDLDMTSDEDTDADLCAFASRLALASLAGLVDVAFVRALMFNRNRLSAAFNEIKFV